MGERRLFTIQGEALGQSESQRLDSITKGKIRTRQFESNYCNLLSGYDFRFAITITNE